MYFSLLSNNECPTSLGRMILFHKKQNWVFACISNYNYPE